MIYCEERPYQNSNDASVHRVFRRRQHVHLCADTDEELRAYAKSIGMSVAWHQHAGRWDSHFDATGVFMVRVLADPRVTKLSRLELVNRWREKRGFPALGTPTPTSQA